MLVHLFIDAVDRLHSAFHGKVKVQLGQLVRNVVPCLLQKIDVQTISAVNIVLDLVIADGVQEG